MAKGDGSIQQLGRNKWRVAVSLGNDPITGKRRRVTQVVNGTKAEAKKVRDDIVRDHENGLRIDAGKVTFGEFAKQWQAAKEASGRIGEQRIRMERRNVRDICARIGELPITEVTPQVVETVLDDIRAAKEGRKGSPVAARTMREVHATFRQVMEKAVNYDLIMRNPCDRVETPKPEDVERRSLSVSEGRSLLSALDDAEAAAYDRIKAKEARQCEWKATEGRGKILGVKDISSVLAVRLALATGMRRGEVFGLAWGAVDLEGASLRVAQSLTQYGELKAPKTRAGLRTIALDVKTACRLARWKKEQAGYLSMLGLEQDGETPVFCSNVGGWFDLHNFETWWRRFRRESGFEGLKFHELRHTQATQLLAQGVDVKTVQTRMGHSNASLTLNWYAHAIPENDRQAADMLGELFASDGEKKERPRLRMVKTA